MTHWTTVYALVVQQGFLQGHFLRADLLPCHILSVAGQRARQHISPEFWLVCACVCVTGHTFAGCVETIPVRNGVTASP